MPVQLPSRTTAQVQELLQRITLNSLYPYTFRINRTFTLLNFPNADAGGGGDFVQFTWTPQISLQILILEVESVQPTGALYTAAVQLSASPTMTLGDAASLTVPTDEGNIIMQAVFSSNTTVTEQRFAPSGYYVRANIPLYISFWIATGAIGNAGNIISNLVVHTYPLGPGT